jgi:hypothetical protein
MPTTSSWQPPVASIERAKPVSARLDERVIGKLHARRKEYQKPVTGPAKVCPAKLQYSILSFSVQHDLRIFADQSRVTRTALCTPPTAAVDFLAIISLTRGGP